MLIRWRKARARRRALAARKAAHAAGPDAGFRLAAHFPDHLWPKVDQVVAGYAAIRDEIDPAPLLQVFALEQARLVLPCVTESGRTLVFRRWEPDQPLVRGVFNVPEPAPHNAEATPTLVLTPLVGFDRTGRRLGYGAGFYDRTLSMLRANGPVISVGLAYEAQCLPRVPTDAFDMPVDWIVTEYGACEGQGGRGR